MVLDRALAIVSLSVGEKEDSGGGVGSGAGRGSRGSYATFLVEEASYTGGRGAVARTGLYMELGETEEVAEGGGVGSYHEL